MLIQSSSPVIMSQYCMFLFNSHSLWTTIRYDKMQISKQRTHLGLLQNRAQDYHTPQEALISFEFVPHPSWEAETNATRCWLR